MKILLLLLLFIFITPVFAGDREHNVFTKENSSARIGKMSFTLESSGKFLSRRNDFGYVISGENAFPSPVTGRPRINYDSLGQGGKFTLGYHINDRTSFEFSFQGASVSSVRTSRLISNLDGILQSVPVIDGQSFGNGQQILIILGLPDNTRNLRTKLDYRSWYIDTFLGLDHTILKKGNTELHGTAGIAYAHFEQDFEHEIYSEYKGLSDSSILDEDLRDNLFGLKGGFRLNHRVTKRLQVEGSVFGGVYYRKSKLDADQILTNVTIPFANREINVSASVNDRDSHFVPRVEGSVKVKYKINDRWDMSFSSGVGSWWHMSNINNPENALGRDVNTGTPIDRPVHIGDNDRLIEYHLGLAISFRR